MRRVEAGETGVRVEPRDGPPWWPLWAAWGGFALTLGITVALAIGRCDGTFVYPLDDTYIHLTLARNLAEHGTWGMEPGRFASAASSLVWPILLAAAQATAGPFVLSPLILNSALGLLLLSTIHWIARREGLRPWHTFFLLLAIVFLMPLVPVAMSGMEHIAQTLVDLLFVYLACMVVHRDRETRRAGPIVALLALAPLVTGLRLEGGFLIAVACVLLVRSRPLLAVTLGLLGLAPILIHGWVATARGEAFLPYPVLLKGGRPQVGSMRGIVEALGGRAVLRAIAGPWLAGLLAAALATLLWPSPSDRRMRIARTMLIGSIAVAICHLQWAGIGWFFRYEAYLMVLLLVALALAWSALRSAPEPAAPRRPGWARRGIIVSLALVALVGGAAAFVRAVWSLTKAPLACGNIHDQQIQMARFLARHYRGQPVAANDIGAISYFADVRVFDTYGLASGAVARHKLAGTYNSAALDELARSAGARIAVVYDTWLAPHGGAPPSWIRCGRWRTERAVMLGSDTVSFYALGEDAAATLRAELAAFAPSLPARTVFVAE